MPLNPRIRRFIRRDLMPIALVILLTCCVRSAIADWNIVPTGSMNPSIIEGDRIFVNKLAYGLRIPFTEVHLAQWSTPSRGDVITFRSPKDGTTLVKRVVALPGDTVAMNNDKLLINGKVATYAPLADIPAALRRPPVRRRANRRRSAPRRHGDARPPRHAQLRRRSPSRRIIISSSATIATTAPIPATSARSP